MHNALGVIPPALSAAEGSPVAWLWRSGARDLRIALCHGKLS